jgi:PHP family Zn ribbon phosphoesterase
MKKINMNLVKTGIVLFVFALIIFTVGLIQNDTTPIILGLGLSGGAISCFALSRYRDYHCPKCGMFKTKIEDIIKCPKCGKIIK